MAVDVIMPQMGESIAEGTIVKWHKKVGDAVRKDETLLEISTDKVDSEIPAPASGVLADIVVQENQTVAVRTVIAHLETDVAEGAAGVQPEVPEASPGTGAPAQQAPPEQPMKSREGDGEARSRQEEAWQEVSQGVSARKESVPPQPSRQEGVAAPGAAPGQGGRPRDGAIRRWS